MLTHKVLVCVLETQDWVKKRQKKTCFGGRGHPSHLFLHDGELRLSHGRLYYGGGVCDDKVVGHTVGDGHFHDLVEERRESG